MKFIQYLTEKLIVLGKGERYGQVVFLAGGAGSGKGFAAKNFMEFDKFKIRDVDEWKRMFIELDKIKGNHPEVRGLDLSKPEDVMKLHAVVREKGIKSKTLNLLLQEIKPDRLPNLMFDVTLKDHDDILEVTPKLLDLGYEPKNIHIVWVLTDYSIAVQNNKGRPRVVPDEILFTTHVGAAKSVTDILKGKAKLINNRKFIDGQIDVILNNPENTIYYQGYDPDSKKSERDAIKTQKGKGTLTDPMQGFGAERAVIKDFKYIRIKKQGQPMVTDHDIRQELADWITNNVPVSKETEAIRSYKIEP